MPTLPEKADTIVALFRQSIAQEKADREAQLATNLEWLIQQRLTDEEWKLFRSWIGQHKDVLK